MGTRLPRSICLSLLFLFFAVLGNAQQVAPQPLITQPVIESQVTTVTGNTHPLAQPQFDIGAAPPDLPMQRMLLVLKRSPEQDLALRKLLDDQQDKASPNYHKWLTPDEFGVKFGPSDQDIQVVTGWLQSHGFQVNRVSHGRTVIEFSGAEAQVEEALHTSIHKYLVNGEEHWANTSDPQIPAALAPAVAGVWSLHDFRKQPRIKLSNQRFPIPQAGASPLITSGGQHALMPGDYATIYNINPLYTSNIKGQGTSIAVVARSNFNTSDVYDFHNVAGVPGVNLNIVNDGPAPGIVNQNEEAEALLDATWSSSIAPSAQLNFVVSASTNTSDGVDLSELYIIDNNAGDVMTESFGTCEGFTSQSEVQAISALAEQAAAQGITYLVSSGDSGAEGCDDPNRPSSNGDPPSVNILASSPFDVAVGGTILNENGNNSKYWNTTNNPTTLASAKAYIPENVWNESCSTCGLWAGGGGASIFFPKPTWQSGVQGIPSDGARDLPDVSLTAAIHDPYLLCFEGSCGQGFLIGIGGTSASAPSFAGIMSLVVQQYRRQGQANYVLYKLAAAETLSQCNGSNTNTAPASTCVFNDTTKGNNAVPGEAGFGTSSAKYQAGTGYDQATGLGSVNVTNLVNKWNTITFNATSTTLSPSSITGVHGSSVTLTASVTPNGTNQVPTGDVSLTTSNGLGVTFLTLNNGSVTAPVNNLPGGTYTLTAQYAGDSHFSPSPPSNAVSVNIIPENSTTTVSVLTAGPFGNPITFTSGPYGGFVYLRVDVAGNSGHGTPTGNVTFTDNGKFNLGPLSLNSGGNTATPNGYFAFSVGQHSVAAQYQGDSSFNGSSSSSANFSITQASTTNTVTTSPSQVAQGSVVALTASVASPAFAGFFGTASPFNGESQSWPGGTVTFYAGATQLGVAQQCAQRSNANGYSSLFCFNTSSLPPGQNSITAQYSGDSNYLGSNAAPVTVTVQADFTFSAAGPSITISSPGGSGNLALTITGQTGYSSTVNFSPTSCSGLPFGAHCTFNPASVTGSGSTTVTVSTTAPTFAGLQRYGWTGFGFVFAGVFLLGVPSRRFRCAGILLLLVLVFVAGGIGCGGGGSGGGVNHSPGTPKGSYPITVTASSGAITHTASFTLVVQ